MGYLLCYLLIALTGSPSFHTRDRATRALCFVQRHGGVPSEILSPGLHSQDPEIRARAGMVAAVPIHRCVPPFRARFEGVPAFAPKGEFEVAFQAKSPDEYARILGRIYTNTGASLRGAVRTTQIHGADWYVGVFSH